VVAVCSSLLADEMVFLPLFVRSRVVASRAERVSIGRDRHVLFDGLRPQYWTAYRTDLGDAARDEP
jgi:hypothetical protein